MDALAKTFPSRLFCKLTANKSSMQDRRQPKSAPKTFASLPPELHAHILQFVSADDRLAFRLVCREFKRLLRPVRVLEQCQKHFVYNRVDIAKVNIGCRKIPQFASSHYSLGPVVTGEEKHPRYTTFVFGKRSYYKKEPKSLPHLRRMTITLATLPRLCRSIGRVDSLSELARLFDIAAARLAHGELEVGLGHRCMLSSLLCYNTGRESEKLLEIRWVADQLGGDAYREAQKQPQVQDSDLAQFPATRDQYRRNIQHLLFSAAYEPKLDLMFIERDPRVQALTRGLFRALWWRLTVRCAQSLQSTEFARGLATDLVAEFWRHAQAKQDDYRRRPLVLEQASFNAVEPGMFCKGLLISRNEWHLTPADHQDALLRIYAPHFLDKVELWDCMAQGFTFGLNDLITPPRTNTDSATGIGQ